MVTGSFSFNPGDFIAIANKKKTGSIGAGQHITVYMYLDTTENINTSL